MTPLEVARRRLEILQRIERMTPEPAPDRVDVTSLAALLARRAELLATWPTGDRATMARVRALAEAILARDGALTVVLADAQRRVVRIMRRSGGAAPEGRPALVTKVL